MALSQAAQPALRPRSPMFSSGPCAKRPGWTLASLPTDLLGRSHRAKPGKARLKQVIEESKALLGIPADYKVAIMAGSDTGAFEAALWSLLGARPADAFAWDVFGKDWATDTVKQLKVSGARHFTAPYGELPTLAQADFDHDIVFVWNGTTAGVRVPNGDWIPDDRRGLTICDATSAILAMDLPWTKLDVVTYSWQKALGGEAAHGMLILSPRAVARLESYTPPWPVPKIFRLTKGGALNAGLFEGETINTPSMLCVEDVLDAMAWARSVGGLAGTIGRVEANMAALSDWVGRTPWIDFLAKDAAVRSPTSVCLKIVDPTFQAQSEDAQRDICKTLSGALETAGVAFDINAHREAPPGLRVWCGSTVEAADVTALTAWMDWAWAATQRASSP